MWFSKNDSDWRYFLMNFQLLPEGGSIVTAGSLVAMPPQCFTCFGTLEFKLVSFLPSLFSGLPSLLCPLSPPLAFFLMH